MRKKGKQEGFTLIELLVVIAIIGLLSSIVLAALNTARSKARDARRISDMHQIRNGLEIYYSINNAYPTSLTQMIAAKAMPSIPIDPLGNDGSACRQVNSTSNGYCYSYNPSTGPVKNYHLGSQVEKGSLIYATRDAQFYGGSSSDYVNDFDGTVNYIYDLKN